MSDTANTTGRSLDALLLLSRAQTRELDFERVDITRVMRAVRLGAAGQLAETGGSLSVGEMPTIEADSAQTRQLFQNLVDNSLRLAREGVPASVTIHAEVIPAQTERLRVGEELCRVYIEDGGIGLHASDAERMFVPLQQLENTSREGQP
ncbi:MAG: ATP-binding protein [Candidatus Poribacteria bacterium]